ncbi:hypothetical protein [Pedobacter jamesrossensis]|uniref:Uncharacterized protein n=1 Tax=Pedobacter jamesrossensis TaxID=1908238 RepID=A0ABV8NL31_9SPHI
MEKKELIPSQQIGQQTDAEEEKIFPSAMEAKAAYAMASRHLLDVNEWQNISTIEASSFMLCDRNGIQLNRAVHEGDYIQIDIPGPGTSTGKGFDWVFVEHMEVFTDEDSDIDFTLFVARPSSMPGVIDGKVSHFFTDRSTSTFMVFRRGDVLSIEVHGRNEVPNMEVDGLLDKARNILVNGGSGIGMSFIQWHLLVSGILSAIDLKE